jgi:hypothetical protein
MVISQRVTDLSVYLFAGPIQLHPDDDGIQ